MTSREVDHVLSVAREMPELSPRQLAAWVTDNMGFSVSESTVYRILRREGLVKRPEMRLAADKEYHRKTTGPHQMWATDASYFRVVGCVSANVKMGEIARMELTHLRERASSTETPWRWCKEIVKGGNSERDIRNERVGLFHSGYSQGIGHCPEYGTAVPEGSGSGYAQAAAAAVIQVGPVH